jgi:hypothetical protein
MRRSLLLVLLLLAACAREGEHAAAPGSVAVSVTRPDGSGSTGLAVSPLEELRLSAHEPPAGARWRVSDGDRRIYADVPADSTIVTRGALGRHRAALVDTDGRELAHADFTLDARTRIADGRGDLGRWTTWLQTEIGSSARDWYIDGKRVRHYVGWLRDDTHVLLATRYWEPDLEGMPQLFIDHQQPDGMIWDLAADADDYDPHGERWLPHCSRLDLWGPRWAALSSDGRWRFERIPVEADVEYLLVQNVHRTWQATGDDGWMERALPACERALGYSMGSPLRWSPEHGLMKRGFTIDTWDFQHEDALAASPNGGRNPAGGRDRMWIEDGTPMGLMHGDESGLYDACVKLSAMHVRLGHADAARRWADSAARLRENTDRWCWNGRFYTHQVHLTPVPGDRGVDENEQLSLSNAYDLNRGLPDQAKCASIIAEYRARRELRKDRSFAEWFTIDPAFPAGFGGYLPGEYMNGGVTPIVAGELARGALTHGFEAYGVDIVERVGALLDRDRYLHAVYHPGPRQPDWKPEQCRTLDLRPVANRAFAGDVPDGWTGEGVNDLRDFPVGKQEFCGHPFDVIDPKDNGGHGALLLRGGHLEDAPESVSVAIGGSFRCLYILHACTVADRGKSIATYTLTYADGTTADRVLWPGGQIDNWWDVRDHGECRAAWRGANRATGLVGIGCFAWWNPHPEKEVASITFKSAGNGVPMIIAATVSDEPVQWPWGRVSNGIPDSWAAAAVYAATVEGIAGVGDPGCGFETAEVAPRWTARAERSAEVIVRYGAGRGYVAYRWNHDPVKRAIRIEATGSGGTLKLHQLMPPDTHPSRLLVAGREHSFSETRIEGSVYADATLTADERDDGTIEIGY